MATPTTSPLTAFIHRFLPRLRYPYLFVILAALFLIDLVIPDPVPMIDELILAVLTFVAATLTTRRDDSKPPRDVTPPDEQPPGLESGKPQPQSED